MKLGSDYKNNEIGTESETEWLWETLRYNLIGYKIVIIGRSHGVNIVKIN
jgi:hypothetical protein